MEKIDEGSILESLSGNNEQIFEHLAYILQDLWELGGGKEELIDIIKRNFRDDLSDLRILDLCCGKGANLITLSKELGCSGLGIDLFAPFIEDAKNTVNKLQIDKKIEFLVLDIRDAVREYNDYDLVLYGNDTNVLGDEETTIKSVLNCCKKGGFLLYHTSGDTCASKFNLIDSLVISQERKREINNYNNICIKNRCYELVEKFPQKKEMFVKYIEQQENESEELINNMNWCYYLIKNESNG